MKKYIILFLSILLTSTILAKQPSSRIDKSLTIYTDVLRQLDISYADTLNYEDLIEKSINYMLRQLDPYTVYLPEDKTSDLRFMTTGKYGGIGAVIMQREGADKKPYVIISDPYEGMPAQQADLRAGDKILKVDGKSAIGKTSAEVSKMLRGTPDSEIVVEVQREGIKKPIVKTFIRKEIRRSPVEYAALFDNIGYIYYTDFTEGSARIFTDTLHSLVAQGAESLIIDLRGNGGGLVDEGIKILANFLPKGTEVVSMKGRSDQDKVRTYRTPIDPKYPEMPLVVLVDGQSASASEIVAGALQDLDRATIIGERTFGKGLVQNIRQIAHGGHLKVTTSKYYIPSGRCIQAVKYNHDGSAERVPDSLTTAFKTAKGRIVRDGGGIQPDIEINDSNKVTICYSLYMKHLFFDYATRFRSQHESIAPLAQFEVSDSIITDFIGFLKEKEFTYETETSKYFKDMMKMAKWELDSTTLLQLEEMQKHLNPTFEDAIWQNVEEVKSMLGQEIAARYYFQRGPLVISLRNDKVLKKGIKALR